MMGLELLKHWKKFVDIAIQDTWLAFNGDGNVFLTENDVKCYLFNELRKTIKIQPYTVHSEVTHYAEHQNARGYRFRDLVLLNPERLLNNADNLPEEILDGIKPKGFQHIGETIFFEIKFQRNQNTRINENDLVNLTDYEYNGGQNHNHPKFAILIWSSKHQFINNNLVGQMTDALDNFSHNVGEIHIPFNHVFGFVFNQHELHEIRWEGPENNGEWVPQQIV